MKNAILAIDLQNDFVKSTGSLSVPGAEEDAVRIVDFMKRGRFDNMYFTLDTHRPNSIFFCEFWKDKDGNHPAPFTTITTQDIKDGKWTTAINPQWSMRYPEELEKKGKYALTLWPHHCMAFTEGFTIVPEIMAIINEWESKNFKFANFFMKGSHIMTENYSVFQAEIPYPNAPETQIQQYILTALNSNDVIYFFGQAQTHCVKFTLDDLNTYAPELVKKLVILEDCMSPIGLFDINTDPVYQKAVSLGAKIMKSTEVIF